MVVIVNLTRLSDMGLVCVFLASELILLIPLIVGLYQVDIENVVVSTFRLHGTVR